MSIITSPLLLGADTGSQVSRSLRFNSVDSAYCNRTFGTPTTQGTFTLSMWVKRSALGSAQSLFGVSTNHSFGFTTGNSLNLTFGGTSALTTTALFRDSSAWYHIVWTQSGTSHTVYVNGISQGTATATSSVFNTAVSHQLGANNTTNYFNGYFAKVYFIDGQALTPSAFTTTDLTTGQLTSKVYIGSYGANGFRLEFADNSSNTATTLGKDASDNGNNWTPNNLSVTAGAGNDSLVDTPTSYGTDTGVGGEVRGNYATLNPLVRGVNIGQITFANGNLDATWSGGGAIYAAVLGSIGVDSGKWYWETLITGTSGFWLFGVASANVSLTTYIGGDASGYGYYNVSGNKYNNNSTSTYGSTYTTGDIISVAFDADNGKVFFAKNGTWQNSGNPATGTNAAFTGLTGSRFFPAYAEGSASAATAYSCNFGQRAFAYTAPSGFKALCDTNLPTPVIAKPNTVMDTVLYTGNGAARSITGLAFNPDLVWLKSRSANTEHKLTDSVRGVTKSLGSDSTSAEATDTNGLTAFNSDGFSLGTETNYNNNAATYVAWAWDSGTSTVTNTAGSVTSQVKANASAGFSVVTYTGTGSNATVGHGLGVAPRFIIVKSRSIAPSSWKVYHVSTGPTQRLNLNTTDAAEINPTIWNNTAPTSSVFSIGTNDDVGQSSATYVSYCFAPVSGYSLFSSYTGNGSSNGPFVFTGMRPRWILQKKISDAGNNWRIFDTARDAYNVASLRLFPNSINVESTLSQFDILSNGFKIRDTDSAVNANGEIYIYAAFAESPFQYARAR